jgi:hypothetical protein
LPLVDLLLDEQRGRSRLHKVARSLLAPSACARSIAF